MDITSYIEARDKGLLSLQRYGPDFAIRKRKFNADTGEETLPETQAFKRDDLVKQRALHQKTIAEIDALLADLDALK